MRSLACISCCVACCDCVSVRCIHVKYKPKIERGVFFFSLSLVILSTLCFSSFPSSGFPLPYCLCWLCGDRFTAQRWHHLFVTFSHSLFLSFFLFLSLCVHHILVTYSLPFFSIHSLFLVPSRLFRSSVLLLLQFLLFLSIPYAMFIVFVYFFSITSHDSFIHTHTTPTFFYIQSLFFPREIVDAQEVIICVRATVISACRTTHSYK